MASGQNDQSWSLKVRRGRVFGSIGADVPSRASDWGQKWEFQGSIWWSDSGCSAWFIVRL